MLLLPSANTISPRLRNKGRRATIIYAASGQQSQMLDQVLRFLLFLDVYLLVGIYIMVSYK